MASQYAGEYAGQYAQHTVESTVHKQTTEYTSSASAGVGFNKAYLKTIPGILKIVEIVIDFLILITCAATPVFNPIGGGWAYFHTSLALIITIPFFVAYLFNFIHKLPGKFWLILQVGAWALLTVCLLITGIVSAVMCSRYSNLGGAGAVSFFSFAGMIAYGVDTFFFYQDWRNGQFRTAFMDGEVSTQQQTTTTTTYEQQQY